MDAIYQGNMGFDNYERNLRYERRLQRQKYNLIKKIFIFCITLMLVLSTMVIFGNSRKYKTMASEEQLYKYYTSITVQPGDTLWTIAKEYMNPYDHDINGYIDEVVKTNHLSSESIHAGQNIIISYYSPELL